MEPIVNPWFIYLLDIVYNLRVVSISCMVIAGFFSAIYIIGFMISKGNSVSEHNDWKFGWGKKGLITIVLFLTALNLVVFIPTKNTIISMFVADKVTYNVLDKSIEGGKLLKDELKRDIIDIISSINNEIDKTNTKDNTNE